LNTTAMNYLMSELIF